jgi:hypothetical protein
MWGKIVREILFQKQVGVMVHICNSNYVGGRGRRIVVWGQPQAKMYDVLWKKELMQKMGDSSMSYVVEHLPSKYRALSSNPSMNKNY